MHIALGIDTGGTYTDAVLVNQEDGAVLAATKALTTHHDLALGIGEAVAGVFAPSARRPGAPPIAPAEVGIVGLSTTLATNAIVEGQGARVCLLLIGYDAGFMARADLVRELVTPDVVYLRGGHDGDGNPAATLDEVAAREAILARRDTVAAFAISGYFGVRNPAHELRVKALVEELTASEGGLPLPVTCGHELTTRLNAVRRATTVVLNARLIPILRELILTVRRSLDGGGIAAPLMVVKGDGSLVRADWAVQRPIETVLSGPAASVVGAWHIAGRRDAWVVDVGGTTTDIAALRDGRPRLNPQGAQVGGWRTMVQAADVRTVGLGGDSRVYFGPNGTANEVLHIGPERVVPLCRLSSEYPAVREALRRQTALPAAAARKRTLLPLLGRFLLPRRRDVGGLGEAERAVLAHLDGAPRSLLWLAQHADVTFFLERVERLVAQQAALLAGFTPTDALHALGRFAIWDVEAARLGAELLAARAKTPVEVFCRRVVEGLADRVTTALVGKVLHDEAGTSDWAQEPVAAGLLARALGAEPATDLACAFTLRQPLVAVGAPVAAYLPRTAAHLHTELVIPEQAGVANAVGAVAGGVVQRLAVLVRPMDFAAFYRAHLPDGVRDFDALDAAIAHAREAVAPLVAELARRAGAEHVEVQVQRHDRTAAVEGREGETVFLETELVFTAVGRPRIAAEAPTRVAL